MVDRNMCVSQNGSRNDSLDGAEVYYLTSALQSHTHSCVCFGRKMHCWCCCRIVAHHFSVFMLNSLSLTQSSRSRSGWFNWNSLVVFFFRFGILCHTNFGGWNGNLNNFKIYWTVRSNKANMLGTFIHIHIRYNILWINDCNECVDVLLLLLLLAFIFAHHIVFNMHCSLWSEYSSTLLRTHTCTCTEFKY